jgi:hypothetical protein
MPPRQATQPGGLGSVEPILGLLKSLKVRARKWRLKYMVIQGPPYFGALCGSCAIDWCEKTSIDRRAYSTLNKRLRATS